MNIPILIIFGKPGAGKSYIAEILEKSFGYFSYNGDDALPPDMKEKLFLKAEVTDDMRRRFLDNMIFAINKLSKQHAKLVVHQTFLKEFMREHVLATFPIAKFLLIETENSIRENRYMQRKYFNLGLPYLRHMTDLFEPVSIPHMTLNNNKEGTEDIETFIRDNL